MSYPIPSLTADHVCLGVDNMDAMIEWYRRVLGFALEIRWTVTELPGYELAYLTGPGGFRIELIAGGAGPRNASCTNVAELLSIRGANHFSFRVADVDAAIATVQAAGAGLLFPPTDFPGGPARRIAFLKDLEENVIEFVGPLKH